MTFQTRTSPHVLTANSVTRVMGLVLLALIPGLGVMTWLFGWGVLINAALATLTAVAAEALFLRLRQRPVLPAVSDLSAVVTAVLLAICLPPLLPWWLTVGGTLFAILIVKQLYGGLGYNPFNPAMAGYVLLLVSFPVEMTRWSLPLPLTGVELGLLDTLQIQFAGGLPEALSWDALSGATPLDQMRQGLDQARLIDEIRQAGAWGLFGGQGWEWISAAFLLGGLVLLWRGVISWHIPVGLLGGLAAISGLFWLFDPATHPSPAFHLVSGGAMLGAFFIATDPVSASTTKRGQLIFGAGIGVLIYIIRSWGGYPDAVAFAVLLMNMAAPTIDYYTQPRVFGARKGRT